ncbi:MAG: nitroreductase family protein [Neisseriaceae bacterium]|nr:nitroreductase family protein [Neisseriaceae bacterium]
MSQYLQALKNRRSIYALGNQVALSNGELATLIKTAVDESPSSFNSQSSRAVILFDQAHERLWDITEAALRALVPAENFGPTAQKMAAFKAAKGTVLFYEDTSVIEGLQAQFAAYADNFPIWSEHSTAIAQHSVWATLAEHNVGASLQHYNPVIDAAVQKEWALPSNWVLRAQMPFGSIEAAAGEKQYMAHEARYKVFG